MKRYLAVCAIALALIVMISAGVAFAEISLSKTTYYYGETVKATGTVQPNATVLVLLVKPDGTTIPLDQVVAGPNGEFTYELQLPSEPNQLFPTTGTYKLVFKYAGITEEKPFTLEFPPTGPVAPEVLLVEMKAYAETPAGLVELKDLSSVAPGTTIRVVAKVYYGGEVVSDAKVKIVYSDAIAGEKEYEATYTDGAYVAEFTLPDAVETRYAAIYAVASYKTLTAESSKLVVIALGNAGLLKSEVEAASETAKKALSIAGDVAGRLDELSSKVEAAASAASEASKAAKSAETKAAEAASAVKNLEAKVGKIEEISSTVESLKTELSGVKSTISGLKDTVASLEASVGGISTAMTIAAIAIIIAIIAIAVAAYGLHSISKKISA